MASTAVKKTTRAVRMAMIAVWGTFVAASIFEVAVRHRPLRFLTGLGIAVGFMVILRELKALMEEPS